MTSVEPERVLLEHRVFELGASRSSASDGIELQRIWSSGSCEITPHALTATFSNHDRVHKLNLSPDVRFVGNGVSFRLKISGFASLQGLRFGFVLGGTARQIEIPNVWRERWIDVSFGVGDLIFGIQNDWLIVPGDEIGDVFLQLEGCPEPAGAEILLERVELWHEDARDFRLVFGAAETTFSALMKQPNLCAKFQPVLPGLMEALEPQLRRSHSEAEQQAIAYMTFGAVPSWRTTLSWPIDAPLPPELSGVNTNRWAWHALHPTIALALFARRTGNSAALFAARDFVNGWLDRSYYQIDLDQKYCWYDHGVADRLLALILVWESGVQLGFDQRFMARLLEAIARHMQLLGSEAFYASHTNHTRYHNHAVSQDLALMVSALAVPELAGAARYFALAAARVTDQIEQLLVADGEFAVLIENSVSYQVTVQAFVEFADALIRLGGVESRVSALAPGVARFIEVARYPDGRLPGFGDSPRIANGTGRDPRVIARPAPGLTLLRRAGHAFVKGDHEGQAFMLALLATSLAETHKHEDNLSFTLYFDGVEWLIDPSFYSYEPSLVVAQYLRRAPAHNAVVLEKSPYSLAPGLAQLEGNADGGDFMLYGAHDSYATARVTREIRGRLDRLSLAFVDCVTPHHALDDRAALMLHCGDGVTATVTQGVVLLRHPASTFELVVHLPTPLVRTYCGELGDGEPRGFTGLGFMEHVPITTVECSVELGAEVRWELLARRIFRS